MNRKKMGIRHESAHMAVLIQPLLMPEISFIMHTVSPVTLNPDEVYLELAVGLGETLASGLLPGLPYRMVCNKISGQIRMLAFASFSQAVWPDSAEGLVRTTVDYSRIKLSQNEVYRKTLGRRLAAIGQFVEDALKEPQDIEGLVSGDRIYLVQSRPQQGIHPNFH
jgi:phosphoglucan,water dikinase